jgi:hypothetical protein
MIVRPVRGALAAACLVALALAAAVPVLGASVSFGTPSATSTFLKGITFKQPYSGGSGFKEVDLVITYPGSFGPSVVPLQQPGSSSFTYELVTSEGQLTPNTKLTAHFQVLFEDGTVKAGPDISVTYEDTRFKWRTKSGSIVHLHWYSGSDSFASDALDIAQAGLSDAMDFMGVKTFDPIDFFIYPDESPFRDALGPGTRQNVGGVAIEETRTMFALIGPSELSLAGTSLRHELTHMVWFGVTSNAYHFAPRWLSEGIAVYVAQGYDSYDRGLVTSAVGDASLMPLAALGGQFPTAQAKFYLAYAESVAAVDFFVRTYGRPSMDKLLAAFGKGSSDDEAFVAATGHDLAAFDGEWLASVGAQPVSSFGPRPAPTGPIPPGWTGPDGAVASPTAAATGSPSPVASPSTAPAADSNGSAGIGFPLLVAAIMGAGLALAVLAAFLFRRGRSRETGGS